MTTTGTRHGSAVVTLPSDREILITRVFAAPAALVFRAWTSPELVRRSARPARSCSLRLTQTPASTSAGSSPVTMSAASGRPRRMRAKALTPATASTMALKVKAVV